MRVLEPTAVTYAGTVIFLSNTPCTSCGCFMAAPFNCNCGQIHDYICYHCGRYTSMQHESVEQRNVKYPQLEPEIRCTAGPIEHTHRQPFEGDYP